MTLATDIYITGTGVTMREVYDGGDAAAEWFVGSVLPAITAMSLPPGVTS